MGEELMTIGAFSRRTWLSPKALRLYEGHGLLIPAAVDPRTGYRHYTDDQLDDARLIRSLRRMDMPLERVADVLAAGEERDAVIAEFWREVENEIERKRFLAHHLRRLLRLEGAQHMFEVSVRQIPDQVVMTEQRYVDAAGLPPWIGEALGRQHAALAGSAPAHPSFVVYHGEVTEDSDGPVEACTPVTSTAAADTTTMPTRIEPAHTEAYVSLTRAQVEYPQILSAYSAVEAWIHENDHTVTGPPREVYFGDFAADSGPVADIAFPIADEREAG